MSVQVRAAVADDLPRIKQIYDHEVAHSVATFDLEPPPLDYWLDRLAHDGPGHHLLVATSEEGVLGYAYSATYRPRPAYEQTREVSVYLATQARGRGVGRALYDDLLARLRADGVHVVLAGVATPNPASEALHRACGFEPAGLLPEVGFKHGRWVDVGFWAVRLGERGLGALER